MKKKEIRKDINKERDEKEEKKRKKRRTGSAGRNK